MNNEFKSFFHGTMIFSFTGLQFNNVQFTGSELIENSEHSQEWKLSLLWVFGWVRFFVATQNRLGLHYARWKMKNISAKKMGKEKRIQIISDVSQVQPNFFMHGILCQHNLHFFILSFSFNRNKNGVRIMTWHFLYLYFVVFNIGFLFFDDWI